jgi:hypothetical protein
MCGLSYGVSSFILDNATRIDDAAGLPLCDAALEGHVWFQSLRPESIAAHMSILVFEALHRDLNLGLATQCFSKQAGFRQILIHHYSPFRSEKKLSVSLNLAMFMLSLQNS